MANAKRTPCKSCPGGECLVGPYEEIKEECSKKGGQAHHVPPDWTMRQGTRKEALKAKKSSDRIFAARADGKGKKRLPGINKGPAICVKGKAKPRNGGKSQHKTAHECDDDIANYSNPNIPQDTIPLRNVLRQAKAATKKAAPQCADEMNELLEETYKDYDKKSLIRKKQHPKRPKNPKAPRFAPEAVKAWKSGRTA